MTDAGSDVSDDRRSCCFDSISSVIRGGRGSTTGLTDELSRRTGETRGPSTNVRRRPAVVGVGLWCTRQAAIQPSNADCDVVVGAARHGPLRHALRHLVAIFGAKERRQVIAVTMATFGVPQAVRGDH